MSHPALLWGLLTIAVPVAVHFLLRPRPRRVRFPALALMHAVLASGKRASRLQNVALLALRAGLLGGAVLLLAGPTCRSETGNDLSGGAGPTACVVVIDDSLSLSYRSRFDAPDSLHDWARAQAQGVLERARDWPARSAWGVLFAGQGGTGAAALTGTRERAVDDVRQAPPARPHALPLGPALEEAGQLLRAAPQPHKQIVVVTDGAASAWRDVRPALLADVPATVRVLAPTPEPRPDFALTGAAAPTQPWPASAQVPLDVTVRANAVAGDVSLVVRGDSKVLARVGPLKLAPNEARHLLLTLPVLPPGPQAATVELEPADLLTFDQQRHVAWQNAPQPQVLLLRPAAAADDLTAVILRNLLAPELLPAAAQRVSVHVGDASEVGAGLTGPAPALVVVLPDCELPPQTLQSLLTAVQAGATVLLVPGGTDSAPDWPGWRAQLSETAPMVEALRPAVGLAWRPEPAGPAQDEGLAELARCAVDRRVRLSALADGVQVAATYGDGPPAILWRRLGRGRVVALTTSPDPAWSELGVRAAGLLTWLHALVSESLGPPTAVAQFTAGQVTNDVLPALPLGGLVEVATNVDQQPTSRWLRLAGGRPQEPWPTERAGVYALRGSGAEPSVARYVVNWPVEEADLAPVGRAELVERLGTEHVVLEWMDAGGSRRDSAWPQWLQWVLDPGRLLGLVLVAFFILEGHVALRQR